MFDLVLTSSPAKMRLSSMCVGRCAIGLLSKMCPSCSLLPRVWGRTPTTVYTGSVRIIPGFRDSFSNLVPKRIEGPPPTRRPNCAQSVILRCIPGALLALSNGGREGHAAMTLQRPCTNVSAFGPLSFVSVERRSRSGTMRIVQRLSSEWRRG